MKQTAEQIAQHHQDDTAHLNRLGYPQELKRVLGFFDNFSVAFSYLSPMVGVYSLFVLGVGTAGPSYIWLMVPVVGFMLLVALVFGELASHYPIAGALYQYGRRNVGPGYGWWVGWIYGLALLVTVASVDTGVVPYLATLINNLFGTKIDPTSHLTILIVTIAFILIQTLLNSIGARVMGIVARFGVYVETIGTFGVAIALGIAGFHHGFDFLFSSNGAEHLKTNPLHVDFGGSWIGAALVAILAQSYIFYGFESAGDISEETKQASRVVPRAMRGALIYGGIASFVLVAALLLATPASTSGYNLAASFAGGVPTILAELPAWAQNLLLLVVCIAFFSCGTAVQGAGSRLTYSYARDSQLPASRWIRKVSPRFNTPINALIIAAVIPILFSLLVTVQPSTKNLQILWFQYPAGINPLTALVSFGVSGIYLSFLLTIIGSMIAHRRGWKPMGPFKLGKWYWPVSILAAAYLTAMLVNIVIPTGLDSPRGSLFNFDWITLVVMIVLILIGAIYFLIARPDRRSPQLQDLDSAPITNPAQPTKA